MTEIQPDFAVIGCNVENCTYPGDRIFMSVEEKRTDVNIAVEMLDDAYQDCCDVLIVVSGDSDLVPAIQKVRDRFADKTVFVYVPNACGDEGHHEIREAAHKERDLPCHMLKYAQFPDRVPDGKNGHICKPREWM